MRSKHLIIYFFLFIECAACTVQTDRVTDYIAGFPPINSDELIHFESIVNQSKKMTKEEALTFVYYGDTMYSKGHQYGK